jgi:hypothetical protein
MNLRHLEWGSRWRIGRPPRRDLLKDLRHNRGPFTAAIGDKSVRRGLTSLGGRDDAVSPVG